MPNMALAVLTGHLGKQPETRMTQAGKSITSFPIAVQTGYGDHAQTTWWTAKCFGKTGEAADKYLSKGTACTLVGEPSLQEWTDKENAKRYTATITVNKLVLLGKPEAKETEPTEMKKPVKISDDIPFDDEIPF